MVAGFGLIVSEDTVLVFVSLGVVFGFGVIVSADAVLVFVKCLRLGLSSNGSRNTTKK